MKTKIVRLTSAALTLPLACAGGMQAAPAQTASAVSGSMCVEYLDRGISAVGTGSGMLVSRRDRDTRRKRHGNLCCALCSLCGSERTKRIERRR